MARVVRIDDDNWDFVARHARPLEDNFNTALRALFAELEERRRAEGRPKADGGGRGASPSGRRQSHGKVYGGLPETQFERPILEALAAIGGTGRTPAVLERLEQVLGPRLAAVDRQPLASGDLRWKKKAQFARLSLKHKGYLRADSGWGVWEITDEGRRFLRQGTNP